MTYLTVRPRRSDVGRSINRFFEDWFSFPSFRSVDFDGDFSPRVNIKENKDNIRLTFELPGMKKDDIKVAVQDGMLNVSGSREFKKEDKNEDYVRREINSGSFSRSFTLPESVNSEKVSADYKNGLLEIKLDKLEEVKPKEIEVKVS